MAKIPHPTRARKRLRDTGIAAMPLRRSRRIANRKPFRFNDLPPEIRNAIYSMVLQASDFVQLTGDLEATAKALSQVSRTVRYESLGIYYSVNYFVDTIFYWDTLRQAQEKVSRNKRWVALFGKHAAPHMDALLIRTGNIVTVGTRTGFLTMENKHRIVGGRLLIPHGEEFFDEYRALALARIIRQRKDFYWTLAPDESGFLAFAEFLPHSKIDYRVETLRLLLTGLQQVVPSASPSAPYLEAADILAYLKRGAK